MSAFISFELEEKYSIIDFSILELCPKIVSSLHCNMKRVTNDTAPKKPPDLFKNSQKVCNPVFVSKNVLSLCTILLKSCYKSMVIMSPPLSCPFHY